MEPARRTISTAVARKTGSGKKGDASRSLVLHALHHTHFHAAFGSALEDQLVHEAANHEDTAAAALEQVLGRQTVFDGRRVKTSALVAHTDRNAGAFFPIELHELDMHALAAVVAVAVLDCVDHRLAYRDSHGVKCVVIEPDSPGHVVADNLDEIEHVQVAWKVDVDGRPASHRPPAII